MSTAHLSRKIDATKHFIVVYKSILSVFTNEPPPPKKKVVSASIFGSFGPTKIGKITLVQAFFREKTFFLNNTLKSGQNATCFRK